MVTLPWSLQVLFVSFLKAWIRAAFILWLIFPHYWSKILLSNLPNVQWIVKFSTLPGWNWTPFQPCVSSKDCFLQSSWVVLSLFLVVSLHACANQYTSEELRDTLCRFLDIFLCAAVSSLLFCSVNSSQDRLPAPLVPFSQLREASRFNLSFPLPAPCLVSHLSGITVLLCLTPNVLKTLV